MIQENEKLKQNEEIMLAIFEEFLNGSIKPCMTDPDKTYLKEFVNNCEQKLSDFDDAYVRWHIAVLFSEFVINHDIAAKSFADLLAIRRIPSGSFLDFFGAFDYLNWSGKQLYNELKNRKNNPK